MAIGLDRLVVLERTEQTTKLYEVDLAGATNIAGTRWDDAATSPSLEQTDVAAAKIKPVPKTLRLDTADFPDIVGKTEGMALLGDGSLAHHQRRRFRHRRRPHADRGAARDRHRAPLSADARLQLQLTAPCTILRARRHVAHVQCGTLNSLSFSRLARIAQYSLVRCNISVVCVTTRATQRLLNRKSLWHYALQFV